MSDQSDYLEMLESEDSSPPFHKMVEWILSKKCHVSIEIKYIKEDTESRVYYQPSVIVWKAKADDGEKRYGFVKNTQ